MTVDLPATTTILTLLSPYLVALARRCTWPAIVVTLVSVGVVTLCFSVGQFLDGRQIWPLTQAFWEGLWAAWASNQLIYKFFLKDTEIIKALEQVGNANSNVR